MQMTLVECSRGASSHLSKCMGHVGETLDSVASTLLTITGPWSETMEGPKYSCRTRFSRPRRAAVLSFDTSSEVRLGGAAA
eukprot:6194354-Pleurochrysis_carterae.AAC.6